MSEWKLFPQDADRPKDNELVWCSTYPDGTNPVKCYYVSEGFGASHFIRQDTMSPYMISCFWKPLSPMLKMGHGIADNLTSLLTVLESFITRRK